MVADSRELEGLSNRVDTHLTPAESDKGSIHDCRIEAHPSDGVRVLRIMYRSGESFNMVGVEDAESCSWSVTRSCTCTSGSVVRSEKLRLTDEDDHAKDAEDGAAARW